MITVLQPVSQSEMDGVEGGGWKGALAGAVLCGGAGSLAGWGGAAAGVVVGAVGGYFVGEAIGAAQGVSNNDQGRTYDLSQTPSSDSHDN